MLNRLMQTRTNSNPLGEVFPDLDDFFSFTPGELPTVETPGELISDLWSKVEDFPVWDEVHGLLPSNGQLGDVLSTIGDTVSGYLDVSAIAASAGSGSSDDTDDADTADDTDTDDDADDSDDDADASDDTVSADDRYRMIRIPRTMPILPMMLRPRSGRASRDRGLSAMR